MLFPVLWPVFWAVVPEVTIGPDFAETARPVDAAIQEVTVFSDRARVHRRAEVVLPAGVHGLRLPDLPGAALLPTVRLEARGGTVIRLEVTPLQRERLTLEDANALVTRLEALFDQTAKVDAETAVLGAQLQALQGIRPAGPVPENQREGRPAPPISPATWKRSLDFLAASQSRLQKRRQALGKKRRTLQEETTKAQRAVQALNLGALSDRQVQVLAAVEVAKKGPVKLALSYFVPGAQWKPAYDLRYDAKKQSVLLDTAGVVTQATGEAWENVTLHLSTAIPGQSIVLPELLTWDPRGGQGIHPPTPTQADAARATRVSSPGAVVGSDRAGAEREAGPLAKAATATGAARRVGALLRDHEDRSRGRSEQARAACATEEETTTAPGDLESSTSAGHSSYGPVDPGTGRSDAGRADAERADGRR